MRKGNKKIGRILLSIYLLVFCLPTAFFALLRTPLVQQFIAKKTSQYLSAELKTKVEIGKIDVFFPIDISLCDVYIEDLHKKPIINAKEILVAPDNASFNFSSLNFRKILLKQANINIITYKNENNLNFQFIADYFASDNKSENTSNPPEIKAKYLILENCNFLFQNQNKDTLMDKHINFNNINAKHIDLFGENISYTDSALNLDIKHLAVNEKSGFGLNHFATKLTLSKNKLLARNLRVQTPRTNLNLYLQFSFKSLDDFNNFEESVFIDAKFKKSIVGFEDIASFAPELSGIREVVTLRGTFKGLISDFEAENMKIDIGKNTHLYFDLKAKGLPYIDDVYADFNLVNSNIDANDIENMHLPNNKKINLSTIPKTLKQVQMSAKVSGKIDDFEANILADAATGFIKAHIKSKGKFPNPAYNGDILVENIDMKKILNDKTPIGKLTAKIDFSGQGTSTKNYSVNGEANIASLEYNNYEYSAINAHGNIKKDAFEGRFSSADPNLLLDFDGIIDFSKKSPKFDFVANVENVNLTALNLSRNTKNAGFSGLIDLNIDGINIDKMLGSVRLSNFEYFEGNKDIKVKNFAINLTQQDTLNKNIEISSDFIDGNIIGNFVFAEIEAAFNKYISNYIPSYSQIDSIKASKIAKQAFKYDFVLRDVQPILEIFVPSLEISQNTILNGNFDLGNNFMNSQIATNYIKTMGIKSENFLIVVQTFGKNIYLTAQSDNLTYEDSLNIGNLVVNTVTFSNKTDFSINWLNDKSKKDFHGDISGNISYINDKVALLNFNASDIVLNDSLYHISQNGKIEISDEYLRISDFNIFSKSQRFSADGRISKDPYDVLQLTFKDVLLDDFDDLTVPNDIDLDGKVNGYVLLSNLYGVPDYRADINIDKLKINKNLVGDALIKSTWDIKKQAVYSEAEIMYKGNIGTNIPLSVKGFFNPRDQANTLDFIIDLDRFNLKLIQPYLSSFSNFIEGSCSGSIAMKGSIKKPDINGKIALRRTNIHIDYLNMNYSFADSMTISNHEFAMRDITIFDSKGNKAKSDIVILHDHFDNMRLDITLRPEKMQFLNTTSKDNNLFYGTAYASGIAKISGPFDKILFDIAVKTEPGTVFYLPINSSGEVYENDFISFVNKNGNDTLTTQYDQKTNDSGIALSFDIDVTPDAEVQIVFDPKIGDIMKGRGSGRMRIDIDRYGEMLMFGNLEIEQGEYLFTLENIINKRFLIDKGGNISWNGDPYSGKMNLTARYSVKTSLYEIVSIENQSEQYKNKIPINCLMHLTGDLLSPDITFDIDLPNSDENTKNLVKSVIANNEEMNRQVFSLLILNSFIPTERNSFNDPISKGIGNTSAELISNQFSNWISQISNDFDVGFTYNQGDQVTTSQVEIALSTQLLNDRIVIETNLEIGGNELNTGSQETPQSSNIAGDISLEYKITKDGKLRVKAFNRSNPIDIVTNNAPYTQGVAVFFQKDFDKIKDLWIRKKKKNEK